MEDGSVVISILGDRKHIAKELEATRKDIEKTEKKLAEKVSEKSGIESKLEDAMNAAKATSEKIRALKREYRELGAVMGDKNTSAADYGRAASRQAAITKELQMQQPILKAQDADADKLHSRYEAVSAEVEHLTTALETAKGKAEDLANQEEQAKAGEAVRKQLDRASASAERFQKRMLRIARSALVYNLISSALRSAVSYFGKLLNTNQEYRAELAKLQGALLTAFQPLAAQIIPWAVSLLRILTSVVQVVGNLLSLLFGGTLLGSAKSAEALNKQASAISGVGAAAKEAEKQLASFDQINKLNSNKDSGGGGGGVSPDFSDFDKFQTEEYQRELNRLTAILSGSLLALGAILFFTGTNIPLGLGLMAAGAIGLANIASGKWGEVTDDLRKVLTEIFVILSTAFLVIGAILAFSGTGPLNIARGIAMMAIGAAALAGAVYVNWDYIKTILTGVVGAIISGISSIILVIGLILAFSGHPAIGIGMILASASELAAAAYVNWDTITQMLKQSTDEIMLIESIILVIGMVITFTGANLPVGIGLMAVGAAGIAAEAALNWNSLKETLQTHAGLICAAEGILLAIGVILVFTAVATHLGIALIAANAVGLATEAAVNWDAWQEPILKAANAICDYGGAALIAIGAMLLFSGANIPLGIGLILAGIAGRKLADAIPWNDQAAKSELDGVFSQICAVSGTLLVAVGMILLFSGAGTAIGLGMLAAGAALLYADYAKGYDDSEILRMTQETEAKLSNQVADAKKKGTTVYEFAQSTMAEALDNDISGEVLYQSLAGLQLSDDDMRALGFKVIGSGSDAFIAGLVAGLEDSDTTVSDVLSKSMARSINEAALKMDAGELTSEGAAKQLNSRIQSLLESGMLTEDEIADIMNSEAITDTLSRMGLSFTEGYIQGMDKDKAAQAAGDMTQSALDAIADTQDSHSPAKKTEALGKDAVDGYVNGVVNNAASVEAAGQTMVESLANGMASRTSLLDAVLNHIVDAANSMASSVVAAANAAVDAMTSVSYSGGTVRIPAPALRALSIPTLPKLATGAVIPPNAPFAAILGDQRSGTNVETPLATIQQAVSDVVKGNDMISALKEQNRLLQQILERCDIKLDGRSIAETVNTYQRQMSRASGGDGYGSI